MPESYNTFNIQGKIFIPQKIKKRYTMVLYVYFLYSSGLAVDNYFAAFILD